MNRHALMVAMILAYVVCIYYVWCEYTHEKNSISCIVCESNNRNIIMGGMIAMGFATILYEYQRNCRWSFYWVVILLMGIYGVILTDEKGGIHLFFAVVVCIAIMAFMGWNCWIKDTTGLCGGIFVVQMAVCIWVVNGFMCGGNVLMAEVIFIGLFAIFYLVLHWIHPGFCPPPLPAQNNVTI